MRRWRTVILPRSSEIPVNYDDMFIDLRTDNDATNGNHLQSTSNDADYDQLLGQAEHGSIPLQSSILRNPCFSKKLPRVYNETKIKFPLMMPFADPSMAEIHKTHKPDSDPLEPRVTRSKSRLLNIGDLIKGTEVNASSEDSGSDAEPCSDAPRGLVTAVNKKRKRPRVKFKKA
jgi:hypothetical protein